VLYVFTIADLCGRQVHALPINNNTGLSSPSAATGLLWGSIGLAVLTALVQGLVTTMTQVAEDAAMWTFRFRIARAEYLWWTFVSILLTMSLVLVTLSFLVGNQSETVSILLLCTATGIAIVRYAIPAWRNRHFIENRWLAWTGDSRTTIKAEKARLCGDRKQWLLLSQQLAKSKEKWAVVPSDEWGPTLTLRAPEGLAENPTWILDKTSPSTQEGDELGSFVYDDGLHGLGGGTTVSLLWGSEQGFRRRVSRGIGSMPLNLLQSQPVTVDNYVANGLCLAMGVLGRNKGLIPKTLVYGSEQRSPKPGAPPPPHQTELQKIHSELENSSTWKPRPAKVLRGYYYETLKKQYGTISDAFVAAAVELALIMADASHHAIREWFDRKLEQQCYTLNHLLQSERQQLGPISDEMNALYRSSYVSMIISLNYINYPERGRAASHEHLCRPDLHGMALLLMAEGASKPLWWDERFVKERLAREEAGLIGDGSWKAPMAWLLGLSEWPQDVLTWNEGSAEQKQPNVATNTRV
jgi:hypothetical protein